MIGKTKLANGAVLAAPLAAGPAAAQPQVAPLQVPAKSVPGTANSVPVPADVSPQMGQIIGLPLRWPACGTRHAACARPTSDPLIVRCRVSGKGRASPRRTRSWNGSTVSSVREPPAPPGDARW